MRTFLTVLVSIFSFACIADQVARPAPKMAPLQGKIKIVRSSRNTAASLAEAQILPFNNEYCTVDSYSDAGLKLYSHWAHNEKVMSVTEYKYDAKRNKIEERSFDTDGKEVHLTTFKYNASGKLQEETFSYPGNSIPRRSLKYMYAGDRLVTKKLDSMERTDYSYNEKEQITEEKRTIHSSLEIITRYTYDNKGRIRSETKVYRSSNATTIYTYDEHNNEILSEIKTNDGPLYKDCVIKYIYDDHGNWIRSITEVPNDDVTSWEQVSMREIQYY